MISLVPAESSIIVRLEMTSIELDSLRIVGDSSVEVALLAVGKPTIMVKVSLTWLDLDRRSEAPNGLVEVSASI